MNLNLLTIIVCLYLVVATVRGFFRGCMRTLFSMLFLVAVLVLTLLLTPFTSRVIAGSQYVQEFYTEKSEQFLSTYVTDSGSVDLSSMNIAGESAAETPFRAAAAVLSFLLSAAGVRSLVTERLVGFMNGATATVATFLLVSLALLLFRIIMGRRVRRGAVRVVDHILGIPIGFARGMIVVWVILGLVNLLAFLPQISGVALQITESPILTWINANNLIVRGITMLIASMLG